MNWEAIGAIGEVIGAIAVVTTLIYLSVQLRQNTNTVQASIRQDVLSEDRNALYMLVEHPFLNQRTNLAEEQESQLAAFLIAFIRMRKAIGYSIKVECLMELLGNHIVHPYKQ